AERIRDTVQSEHGELHMLVNNAGAAWRGRFGDDGWENVERHMKLNFEAPVRLTEALLPLLRATAAKDTARQVSIVNVASTARRACPGPTRAPTRRASSRSSVGPTHSTPRRPRTAFTWVWCSPGSCRPRASQPRS